MKATTIMRQQLKVDIRTRFIGEKTKIFILFPGRGYRYFDSMKENSAIFLDLPGFPIFEDGKFPGREDVIKSIVISDRIKEWHNHGMPSNDLPVRLVKDVKGYRSTNWRSQFSAIVENFFNGPEVGDIFIVPGPTEDSPVLFGEIVDSPGKCIEIDSDIDIGEIIPARRVKWIREVQRRNLPRWLDRKIPSPNPVRQLERSNFSYIFDLMYERYYFDNRFAVKIATNSEEFTSLDSYLLNQVVLYIAALHENKHENNIKNIDQTPMQAVVAQIKFSEDIPEQRILIQSPGFIVLDAKNIIPLVAAVFMSISASLPAGAQPVTAKIINTADQSQLAKDCAGDIEAEVNQDIGMMGYTRWQELCRAELEARKRALLDPGMPVSK